MGLLVPNAPCGVESIPDKVSSDLGIQFLMHRVELKAICKMLICLKVLSFLMHRVELKAGVISFTPS